MQESLTLTRPAIPFIQWLFCHHLANITETQTRNSLSSLDKTNKNWLPRQRPLRDRKTNLRSFIHSHSSTIVANLAKIGRVEFEIIGRQKSLKILLQYKKET